MDMDLDELEGPRQAPSRPTRFAPKNSKFKPKPKNEPPKPESQELDTKVVLPSPKEELAEPVISTSEFSRITQIEIGSSCTSSSAAEAASTGDGIVKMDTETELKPEDNNPEEDMMEEYNHQDEDPVVREIDVFFTPSMDSSTQLYVMQYPLKPCWRPYELDERCEEVRVKPTTSEVEIDLSLDLDSKNYDPDSDNGVRMTKQVLSSSWKLPSRSGYAVGVLRGNKLHLNPVHATVQLRPSMQLSKSGASNDEELVKKEKSIGPSRKQNKQPENLNEPLKDSGENWIHLKYHSTRSDPSRKYLHKMVAEEDSQILFSMSSPDYVNSICPGTSDSTGGPSKRYLLSLPLEDRLKIWLCKVATPVHRFVTLKHLAPSDSVEDLLEVLKKLCYLVQGLWVPKSSLLELQGVEALVREYTLYLFSKSHCISNSDLPQKSKLKSATPDVLKKFAIQRPTLKDWKFKEPKDMSFVQLHPDIVEEQEQAWEIRGEKLTYQIYGERSAPGVKNPSKTDTSTRLVSVEKDNKSVPKTLNKTPDKTTISDETRQALLKALHKLFHTNKVCSFERICQLLRDTTASKANTHRGARGMLSATSGLDAPPAELQKIIEEVAINIHGVFVPKSTTEHSYDALRKIVIELFIGKERNAQLKKAEIIEAGKMRLKRDDIPTVEYNKVMSELCVSRGSFWVLKSCDGSPN